jgi:hypothetical protein
MDTWFIRANGETAHNNPNDVGYVPNEPPIYPIRKFNYYQKCLDEGFIRYGWPNTGDLRVENPIRLVSESYEYKDLGQRYKTYLQKFSSIKAGDLILMPAYEKHHRGEVYLGIALTVDRKRLSKQPETQQNAYYYYHDISKGDWYDCAHRVNVFWVRIKDGEFSIFYIKACDSPIWRVAFAQVKDIDGEIVGIAQKAGLLN